MPNSSINQYKTITVWVAFLSMLIFVALPLLCLLFTSIFPNQMLDLEAPLRTIIDNKLGTVFWNSLALGLGVVLGTTLLALPLVWILSKTDLSCHAWFDVIIMIPLMTPPYIGSIGWILFMQKNGYLEQFLPAAKIVTPLFFSFGGMVIIMSLQFFPFIYLILRDALIKISGNKEAAAMVHGGNFTYNFRHVFVPLLFSSYAMGVLLIFVKTIAEFGTPATFGRKIGYYVLTSEIYQYISHWPIDFGKATTLASLLLSASLSLWCLQTFVTQRFSYPLIDVKGSQVKIYRLAGLRRLYAWLYLGGLFLLSVGIPYFSIITASLMKLRGTGLQWNNFTLQNYVELLTWGSKSMQALINSFSLALVAATIAVILGTLLALLIGHSKNWLQRSIDFLSLLPNTVPSVIFVVGLIIVWNAPSMPIPLYNTYGMVVLTYVILFLPYTVQYVKANFTQLNSSLFQAGQVFGGSPKYIFYRILLPLILPGMLAGWMMTFTRSFRELSASLMILPPSMETSATYIFSQFEQGKVGLGMAMVVISVGLTTLMLLVINQLRSGNKLNE